MILFYTSDIEGNMATLGKEETRHCLQVLRKKAGDQLHFVDGIGGFYRGLILETTKNACRIEILDKKEAYQKRRFHLHIAIAPTKNINRLEWFLEKSTEIGIDEITPVICQQSERRKLRMDRLQKILLAAMKQSLKAYLPVLNDPVSFKQFIQVPRSNIQKLIAQGGEKKTLKDNYLPQGDVLLVVGPEGDFTSQELQLAYANGYQGVNLGKSRLRTETAGVSACFALNFLSE